MYNLNVSLTAPPLLGIDSGICTTTPRTPEILNSLMAMTNPLEYSFPSTPATGSPSTATILTDNSTISNLQQQSPIASSATTATSHHTTNGHLSMSHTDSHSNSSDSPLDSPAGPPSTPSVQQTRSQLIKAGVKLLIQNKRKHSGGESSDGNETIYRVRRDTRISTSATTATTDQTSDDEFECSGGNKMGKLTPEDEDRRKRRRERNKIAATKCRMKKRERTVNLVNESEALETQNKDLKSQVNELENQKRKLIELLQAHRPECVHQKGYQPLPSLSTITNNNCKYLDDLNYLEQNEVKYSQCLKTQQQQQAQTNELPPGYCKSSPTEIGFVMSPDSGFVKSPSSDFMDVGSNFHQQKTSTPSSSSSTTTTSDYIPNCETTATSTVLPPVTTAVPSSSPLQSNTRKTNKNKSPIVLPTHCHPADNEFITLKNELIDTNSPYTSVQSADRFLFDNTIDSFNNNNTLSPNLNSNNNSNNNNINNNEDKLTSLVALKDNTTSISASATNVNALLEFNGTFDTIIKASSSYNLLSQNHNHNNNHFRLSNNNNNNNINININNNITINNNNNHNDFLILSDTSDTQFTDLDSGVTSYTNIITNGSCLA
uniref:Putative activating transcription factor 3 n=1 Tax=Corethrella appendiculata TaxID=1370023 RepID=U5EER6_9DIPT